MSANKREPVVGNTTYPTKQAAAKSHGVSSATMSPSLSRHQTLEESPVIEKLKTKRKSGNVKPITVDGLKFNSQSAAARHYGVEIPIFNVRIHRKWTPEQAAGLEEYVPSARSGDTIVIDNQLFHSHTQAADHYGISYRTFKSRIDRLWTPRETVGLDQHVTSKILKEPLIIEGVEYKSISAAARRYGISRQTFHLRLKSGKSPEEAAGVVDKVPANRVIAVEDTSVTIGGMVFKNFAEAAEKFNVTEEAFMENYNK